MAQLCESKRWDPNKLNSRNVLCCMNQWMDADRIVSKSLNVGCTGLAFDRNWDRCTVEFETNEKGGLEKGLTGHCTGSLENDCKKSQATSNCRNGVNIYDSTSLPPRKVAASPQQASVWKKGPISLKSNPNRDSLPISGLFWLDERPLQVEQNPKCNFTLVQDYPQFLQNGFKPLSDREKRWTHKVGGTLFTGEGNQVCTASHMHDSDWARPQRMQCQSLQGPKNGRSQAAQNLFNLDLRQPISRTRSQRRMDYLQNKPFVEGKGLQHIFPPTSALHFPRSVHWQSMPRVTSFRDRPHLLIMVDEVQGSKKGNYQEPMSQLKEDIASVRALT